MSGAEVDTRQIARVLLRDRGMRRRLLVGACALVVGMVVVGWGPMAGFLEQRPWLFMGYWLGALAGLVLLIWLALYDMAMNVRDYREAQRALAEERDAELQEVIERQARKGP